VKDGLSYNSKGVHLTKLFCSSHLTTFYLLLFSRFTNEKFYPTSYLLYLGLVDLIHPRILNLWYAKTQKEGGYGPDPSVFSASRQERMTFLKAITPMFSGSGFPVTHFHYVRLDELLPVCCRHLGSLSK
jgi:hypothetical protein